MPRDRKNPDQMLEMSQRLRALTEKHLRIEINDLSRRLGYANPTTLRKVWKGESFPDTERLAKLATIKTPLGQTPNIHWLITGQGKPLITDLTNQDDGLSLAVDQLSSQKKEALRTFIEHWESSTTHTP